MSVAIPVVALYAPLNVFFNVALSANVVRFRVRGAKDDDKDLRLAARIHGNNAEYLPLALLMLLVAELCGGASLWLHVAGGALLAARVSHAVGMVRKPPNLFRGGGVIVTWLVMLGLGAYCLLLRARG